MLSNFQEGRKTEQERTATSLEPIVTVENLDYTYNVHGPLPVAALHDINFTIAAGELVGLIGHTGSGKSTLAQLLAGLLPVQKGRIRVAGLELGETAETNAQEPGRWDRGPASGRHGGRSQAGWRRELCRRVGLVFQYPENQLFAETVYEDVAFGPRNLGLTEAEVTERVQTALAAVGLGETPEILQTSPFALSGGQKRRVALAGVLAMAPPLLILDEPTAGLDARGREELFAHIRRIHASGVTIILISHQMADVARLARRLLVLAQGRLLMTGAPAEVFRRGEELRQAGLDLPPVTRLLQLLRERGLPVRTDIFTVEEAKKELLALFPY